MPNQRSSDKTFMGGYIAKPLMARMKAAGRSQGKTVTDLITELLEKKFPAKRKK